MLSKANYMKKMHGFYLGTQKKTRRGIFRIFRLLANYTQLDVSFQIHYVA